MEGHKPSRINRAKTSEPDPSAKNYYRRLGLAPNATDTEIRQAMRDAARKYHPDTVSDAAKKQEATKLFSQISEAVNTLLDQKQRIVYDMKEYGPKKQGEYLMERTRRRIDEEEEKRRQSKNMTVTSDEAAAAAARARAAALGDEKGFVQSESNTGEHPEASASKEESTPVDEKPSVAASETETKTEQKKSSDNVSEKSTNGPETMQEQLERIRETVVNGSGHTKKSASEKPTKKAATKAKNPAEKANKPKKKATETGSEKNSASNESGKKKESRYTLRSETEKWETLKNKWKDDVATDLTPAEYKSLLSEAILGSGLFHENAFPPRSTDKNSTESEEANEPDSTPLEGDDHIAEQSKTEHQQEDIGTEGNENTEPKKHGFAEINPATRAQLKEAETAYLERYKEFHAKKKLWNSKEPRDLQEHYEEYMKMRTQYAAELMSSARGRLRDKGLNDYPDYKVSHFPWQTPSSKSHEEQDREAEKANKILNRYNRLILYNEIARPAARLKVEARKEALSNKAEGTFMKGLKWVGEKNAALEAKVGKKQAIALRAIISTMVMAPVAATAGTAVGLVWGTQRIGRAMASALFGGAVSTGVADLYESKIARKKQAKAKESLRTIDRDWHLADWDTLESIDEEEEKLLIASSDDTVARSTALVKFFTALGVGAGTSVAIGGWESLSGTTAHENAPTHSGAASVHEHNSKTPAHTESHTTAVKHETPTPETSKPSAHTAAATESKVGAASEHKLYDVQDGEGANQAMIDLRAEFTNSPDLQKTYPVIYEKIMNGKAAEVARALGLSDNLLKGDKLTAGPDGSLVLERLGGKHHVLISADRQLHPLSHPKVHVNHHTTHEHHTAHHPKHQATHARHEARPHRVAADKVQHDKAFDRQADHAAVAAENRAEFEREQKGIFGWKPENKPQPVVSEVSSAAPTPLEHAPRPAPVVADSTGSNEHIATLADFQSTTHTETVPSSAAAPENLLPNEQAPAAPVPEHSVPVQSSPAPAPARPIATLEDYQETRPQASSPETNGSNFTLNPHNIFVDPATPHVYVTEKGNLAVFGGTGDATRSVAAEYAKAHPGAVVRFQAWKMDTLGNPIAYVQEVSADKVGVLTIHSPNPETGEIMDVLDPAVFTALKQ